MGLERTVHWWGAFPAGHDPDDYSSKRRMGLGVKEMALREAGENGTRTRCFISSTVNWQDADVGQHAHAAALETAEYSHSAVPIDKAIVTL